MSARRVAIAIAGAMAASAGSAQNAPDPDRMALVEAAERAAIAAEQAARSARAAADAARRSPEYRARRRRHRLSRLPPPRVKACRRTRPRSRPPAR